MKNFIPTKQYLREALLYFCKLEKCAAESHRFLVEAYGDYTLSESRYRGGFSQFKSGNFDVSAPVHQKSLKTKNWKRYSKKIRAKPCRNYQKR